MNDKESVHKTVNTSLITAILVGLIVAAVGVIFAPDFLRLTNCPAECFDGAVIYTRVYLLGAPAILLYNFGSSIITAAGDTQRPLYYIMAGGVINVLLNVILCLVLPEKVMAVAIATLSAQLLGAVLVISRLCKMDGLCKLVPQNIRFSWSAFGKLIRYGAPIALNNALYPLANLQIQSAINSFGVAATAGSSAASTIESVPSAFVTSFGSTASVFVGQNLGANKPDRVRKSFYLCLIFGVVTSAIIGSALYLSGEFWLALLVDNDASAIAFGMIRMLYLLLFYFVVGANNTLASTIQAYGYTSFAAIVSIFGVLIFRAIWMEFVYPYFKTFDNLMFCFLVSWLIVLAANIIALLVIMIRYRKGIFKKI
jgi:putative MATE family efflux protein